MQFFQHHLPPLLPHSSPKVHEPYLITLHYTQYVDSQQAK